MLSRRVGGLAGLGFVALVGSVNIILGSAGMPQAGASPAEVHEFFADHDGAVTAASSMATLVWVCLAVFAAGLVARLRHEQPERVESWPLLGLAGALMQNAIFAGVVGTQVVLASGTLSDDSFWAVWQLHNALFTLNGTSLALILLAFSVAGLRAGFIQRWHGGLGLTAAGVLAISSFTTPWHTDAEVLGLIGLAGFLMWLVWIGTYSVALLRGGRVATPSVPPAVQVGVTV